MPGACAAHLRGPAVAGCDVRGGGMTAWRTVPPKRRPGDGTAAYKAMMKAVAENALKTGAQCWFHQYGMCNFQGAPFDWGPVRNGMSFSGNHVERVMDGGAVIPDSEKIV